MLNGQVGTKLLTLPFSPKSDLLGHFRPDGVKITTAAPLSVAVSVAGCARGASPDRLRIERHRNLFNSPRTMGCGRDLKSHEHFADH